MDQERYTEQVTEGYGYRKKQKDEFEALIERMRNDSAAKRTAFFQPSTASVAAYKQDARRMRVQVKNMLGWPLGEEYAADFHSPPYVKGVPEANVIYVSKDALGSIYRVEVAAGYGLTTYGILFLPHTPGPYPLAISQHGGGGTPELCSGFYGDNNYNDMTRRVLEQGVAVFAPQLILWNDTYGPEHQRNVYDNQLKHLGSSITAVEIFKIQRALDYLISRPDIDSSKIGMIGLSYGGFYTLYTAALDTRIKAAYSSCFINNRFVIDWPDFTWFNAGNRFLDAEIGALIAPRHLYLEVGIRDELFQYAHARPEIDKIAALYQKLNIAHRFYAKAFDGEHELDLANDGIESFCNVLKGDSGIAHFPEQD
jgi:hypothetical protein